MWLILFNPCGSYTSIPQLLFYTEQEAVDWLNHAPLSVCGTYSYIYVPVNSTPFVWYKRESWQSLPYENPNILITY